jgi:hypothetical protein
MILQYRNGSLMHNSKPKPSIFPNSKPVIHLQSRPLNHPSKPLAHCNPSPAQSHPFLTQSSGHVSKPPQHSLSQSTRLTSFLHTWRRVFEGGAGDGESPSLAGGTGFAIGGAVGRGTIGAGIGGPAGGSPKISDDDKLRFDQRRAEDLSYSILVHQER